MQQYQLVITANRCPETLERLLRVVRHRGFEVISLHSETQEKTLHLQLKVQSEREVELLINQLVKLPDVLDLH
ncbi:acetolactate synthase 2 small subunit [Avibacterium paragallinarum]|uniref:acetolactate synthase 2 small subunit n=1 Tax=Avibacterium paragallinarum TaxID=728 RepID=UPI000614DEB7|nr:acetolactate synthase 2 small subunit [Avibacterium paragallinarum]KAA6209271.1 acetolactate synthase 2 small subunit [Avibacterium paragallinarum]KKB02537.1 acetolactate synthase [Avibacterium paragallinarum]RZN73670.1 acetolactate synthase 2 small subunit [Avibacterium paragallinarum]